MKHTHSKRQQKFSSSYWISYKLDVWFCTRKIFRFLVPSNLVYIVRFLVSTQERHIEIFFLELRDSWFFILFVKTEYQQFHYSITLSRNVKSIKLKRTKNFDFSFFLVNKGLILHLQGWILWRWSEGATSLRKYS